LSKTAHKAVSALMCAVAILAGCHNNNLTSGYGIAWVSFTDEPGDYSAYIVTIDSVTLTRSDGAVVTAIATPEIIDFTQLDRYAEMWGSSAIPIGTYVSATITLDYTNAFIAATVNGLPRKATILDYATKAAPTTYAITVEFDPANQPNITPTYASTSAVRLALDFDLAASGQVDATTIAPTVYVRPIVTAAILPADTKLTRVRGPLINSSIGVGTYTVYVRPFYDEANNIGTLTLFNQPNTIYTVNGNSYVGAPGLKALAALSAGSTIAAAWTTFVPDYNPANGAHAGRFNMEYVVGASSLEDQYTEGLSGDVAQRNGNTLYLLGSTLILNTADTYSYNLSGAEVLLGPGTIVTADDDSTLTGLNANSIAVGQHIIARGIFSQAPNGTVILDATGTSSTNTGSVRMQATEFWGSLVSSSAGSLLMNLQAINNWPVSDYDFAGNGATAPVPAAFSVDSGALAVPAGTVAGDPVWATGFVNSFGSAPPDLRAVAVNNEASVQVAGGKVGGGVPTAPGTGICGLGSEVCDPASLQVLWSTTGSVAPFVKASVSGFSLNLSDPALVSAIIRIGPESIDMKSLPASPTVVPTALPATSTFAPLYAVGNPNTFTTAGAVTSSTSFYQYSTYPDFITELSRLLGTTNPAQQVEARGIYDRTTNTFTATSINFVL
jgi:hypothetical protein